MGLLQVLVFGGAGLGTGLVTGLVTIGGTAIALFLAVLVWYVLGFAFYAMLYAAMGSLVSRQEDVNSATMRLNILAFASFFAAQFSLNDPDSTWVGVLAWIPPFSAMLMPLRIAADLAGPAQLVVTVVTMLVVTAAGSGGCPDLRAVGAQHRGPAVAATGADPERVRSGKCEKP